MTLIKDIKEKEDYKYDKDIKNLSLNILNLQCLLYRTIGEFELAQDYSEELHSFITDNNDIDPLILSDIYTNLANYSLALQY